MSGGYDQAVRVWDMRSRSYDAVQTIKLFADSVTTVAVSARCPKPSLDMLSPQPSAIISTNSASHAHTSAGTAEHHAMGAGGQQH